MEHYTGYHVWIFGERSWHRSKDAAIRKAEKSNFGYANGQVQVIDVKTGRLVWGRAG